MYVKIGDISEKEEVEQLLKISELLEELGVRWMVVE